MCYFGGALVVKHHECWKRNPIQSWYSHHPRKRDREWFGGIYFLELIQNIKKFIPPKTLPICRVVVSLARKILSMQHKWVAREGHMYNVLWIAKEKALISPHMYRVISMEYLPFLVIEISPICHTIPMKLWGLSVPRVRIKSRVKMIAEGIGSPFQVCWHNDTTAAEVNDHRVALSKHWELKK